MYIGVFLYICLGKSVRSPRTRLTDSCKLLYGCWELNHSPLREQTVLLTSEPSLQLCLLWIWGPGLFMRRQANSCLSPHPAGWLLPLLQESFTARLLEKIADSGFSVRLLCNSHLFYLETFISLKFLKRSYLPTCEPSKEQFWVIG